MCQDYCVNLNYICTGGRSPTANSTREANQEEETAFYQESSLLLEKVSEITDILFPKLRKFTVMWILNGRRVETGVLGDMVRNWKRKMREVKD